MSEEWLAGFPQLQSVHDRPGRRVIASARVIRLAPGTVVYRAGEPPGHYLLVLRGSVRVYETTENGNEIGLYHVAPGQPCVLTTSCLLGNDEYPAEGITEGEVEAVAIAADVFREGVALSTSFRNFVFSSYGKRLSDLMMLVQTVAFGRLDARLAASLLRNKGEGRQVQATHQQLAAELGTAREVVSRHLKTFEKNGWIELHRGTVDILKPEALEQATL